MKNAEIKFGGFYQARVSGDVVTVRVDGFGTRLADCRERGIYYVTNLKTGRKLTFQSSQKFRMEVSESGVPV